MRKLSIVGNIHASPDQSNPVKAELVKRVPITQAKPDCIQYDLHQDNDMPAYFMFYENRGSRELWQAPMNTLHLAAYIEATDAAVAQFTATEMTHIS